MHLESFISCLEILIRENFKYISLVFFLSIISKLLRLEFIQVVIKKLTLILGHKLSLKRKNFSH